MLCWILKRIEKNQLSSTGETLKLCVWPGMAEPGTTLWGARQLRGSACKKNQCSLPQSDDLVGGRKIAGIDKEKHISEAKGDSCRLPCPSQKYPAGKHEGSTKRDIGPRPLGSAWPLGLPVACFAAANPPQIYPYLQHIYLHLDVSLRCMHSSYSNHHQQT